MTVCTTPCVFGCDLVYSGITKLTFGASKHSNVMSFWASLGHNPDVVEAKRAPTVLGELSNLHWLGELLAAVSLEFRR